MPWSARNIFKGTLFGGILASAAGFLSYPADAFGPVCVTPYQLLTPPCCPSPCPIFDQTNARNVLKFIDEQGNWFGLVSTGSATYSPVDPGQLRGANLLLLNQAIRAAVGRAEATASSASYTSIHFPETDLSADHLPVLHATIEPGAEPEEINAARRRIDGQLIANSKPDATAIQEQHSKRADLQRTVASNAYSRALQKRVELARLPDRQTHFESLLAHSGSLPEDLNVNSTVRLALLSLEAEAIELLNIWSELRTLNSTLNSVPFFGEHVSSNAPAEVPPEFLAQRQTVQAVVHDAEAYKAAVARAVAAHNALTERNRLMAMRENIVQYVSEHEARKRHEFLLERDLKGYLNELYFDPDYAFGVLRNALRQSDRTTYGTPDRYDVANQAVGGIIDELLAQSAQTAFGRRRPNVNCNAYGIGSAGEECLPYDPGPFSGLAQIPSGGVREISQYYASVPLDSYRIVMPALGPESDDRVVPDIVYLGQYYLESTKRKLYWDDIRRGDQATGPMMSMDLWQELERTDIECFMGPMTSTTANIAKRPEFFDVAPSCSHHTWTPGAQAGEVINHAHLGGMDQSIWMIDNALNDYARAYGGRPEIDHLVLQAESLGAHGLHPAATGLGLNSIASDLDHYASLIDMIKSDPSNQYHIDTLLSR